MRYLEAENPYIIGRFDSGDTVTITVYKLSDDTKEVDAASMVEIGTTGYFKYQFNPSPAALTEYVYIMTNSTEEHAGKIILGGYPNEIKDETDKIQTGIIDVKSSYKATGFSTHSAADVKTAMEASGAKLSYVLEDTNELQTNQGNWITATGFATENPPSQVLSDYKADTSALSTEANATTNKNSIITEVNENEAKIDALQIDLDNPNQYKADVSNLDVAVSTRNATTPPTVSEIRTEMEGSGYKLSLIEEDTNELQVNQGNWATATGFATQNPPSQNLNDYKADVSTLAIEGNVETHLTNSLDTYDAPTRSEATSDKDEIITEVNANETKIDTVIVKTNTIDWTDIDFIRAIEGGRWQIINNQMIFYDSDNTTEVATFNLFDKDGVAAETDVTERKRV